MRIQHNIMAMNAYRNYNNNTSALSKNLERLSSGYKINRAGDDAAGLAISEKMRAQITGLDAAQKNVKDGISLVNTAEGAMQEIQDMLNRMVYLATQSANGTYDNDVDRANLQKEVDSLKEEINRIADSANFNGIKLMDGSMQAKTTDAVAMTMKNGAAVASSMVDGTKPSPANNAEITVKMTNSQAYSTKDVKYNIEDSTDGTTLDAADKAKFTIKIGGLISGTTFGATGNITSSGSQSPITNADVSSNQLNLKDWTDGDTLTLDDSNGQQFTYTAQTGDDWNTLKAQLEADGFTVGSAGANDGSDVLLSVADVTVTLGSNGSNDTITINSATGTDVDGLANLQIKIGGNAVKLGDYFDISVANASGAVTGSTKLSNGDTITLEAKFGGDVTGTDYVNELVDSIVTEIGGSAVTGPIASTSTVTDSGKQEGGTSIAAVPTKYEMTFDISKLASGQKFEIDGQTFEITNGNATSDASYIAIDISGLSDTSTTAGIDDEIANAIKSAIIGSGATSTVFGDKFILSDTISGLDGTTTRTFTLTFTGKPGELASDTNLGEGRISVAEANADAIKVEYTEGMDGAAGTAGASAFAKVVYTDDGFKASGMIAGSKFSVAGMTVEIIDSAEAGTDANQEKIRKGLAVSDAETDIPAAISAAFEKQKLSGVGSGIGKVEIDTTAGTLTITGTTRGQTAAQLADEVKAAAVSAATAADPNAVTTNLTGISVYDKSQDSGNASTIFSGSASSPDLKIIANTTKIKDLMDRVIDTNGTKLGDAFDIEVIQDGATTAETDEKTVIGEGATIKFTAKDKGKLDADVMSKFAFGGSGLSSIQIQEGNDEGQSAVSANTKYELTFDMSKLVGGNAFTFGNVNGKSVTFEISFDPNETHNGDVAPTPDDVSGNDNHVVINLFGKTEEQRIEMIKDAINGKMGTDFAMSSLTTTNANGATELKVTLNAKNPGPEYNLGGIRFSANSNSMSSKVYIPAGGANDGLEGTYAQVSYDFDIAQLKVGDSLTIGNKTVHIGDEDSIEVMLDDNGDVIGNKFTIAAEGLTAEKLISTFEKTGYQAGQLRIADGKLTITGVEAGEKGAELAERADEYGGKVVWTASADRDFEATEGGLMLQIGDTSDTFNQLQVSIGDMHVAAMHGLERDASGALARDENGNTIESTATIESIDVSTQAGAQAAINVIKDAINYVSSIRGDLGAISNRLDHTANNLSVMEENITDAESTIRDTDIAEEMMAYTKNNILVQSAQAMLAQANQVPQGVLQLLQ